MQRANFWGNLLLGIGSASFGLVFLLQFFLGTDSAAVYFLIILIALSFGFNQIQDATQSLEINDSMLIYQSTWKIIVLSWSEIGAYVLNDERFVAFDQDDKIVLDIGLRSNDGWEWPVQECVQTRKWIQRKMDEVGAMRKSSLSLDKTNGLQWKP